MTKSAAKITQVVQKIINSTNYNKIGLQQILNCPLMSPILWTKEMVISRNLISVMIQI